MLCTKSVTIYLKKGHNPDEKQIRVNLFFYEESRDKLSKIYHARFLSYAMHKKRDNFSQRA